MTIIEDKEDILLKVFQYYSSMYRSNPEVTHNHRGRRNILELIQCSITEEENEAMLLLPSKDEIEWVVQDLPKGKSSGIDGVTMEILQQFWPMMKPTCVVLVHVYWNDGKFATQASVGVIKLIPKNMEILLLLN